MKRQSILTAIAIIAFVLGASTIRAATKSRTAQGNNESAQSEESKEQAKLARQAKISMEQARETALKRAPGTVESAELEREHKRLVYSFDIRNAKGTITEVQVSAITGKVVSVEEENAKKEAAEKEKEGREKSGNKRQP
jgi:uncharacterized membrane protein YkoI